MKWTVLESLLPVTDDEFARNLRVNLERDIPRCEPLPERENNRLAIVGSGPSVRDYLDEIKSFDAIWAINGAYNFLQDNGIVADFVGCDPLVGLDDYLKHPNPQSVFYLAGTCDATTFEAVKGHDVRMWFLKSDNLKYPPGLWTVTGGTTCLLRAPFLAHMQGFRDLTIYGADSSYEAADKRYCYRYGTYVEDSKAPLNVVYTADGQGPFYTEICLMKQVSQFHAIKQIYREKMEFRCGGLLDAFMRSPTCDDSVLTDDAA